MAKAKHGRKKSKTHNRKRLSLYPLKPENALAGLMEVDPKKVKEAIKRRKDAGRW
jgi:hypothetical protein